MNNYMEIISDAIDSIENHDCPMCGCDDTYYVADNTLECSVCGERFSDGNKPITPRKRKAA